VEQRRTSGGTRRFLWSELACGKVVSCRRRLCRIELFRPHYTGDSGSSADFASGKDWLFVHLVTSTYSTEHNSSEMKMLWVCRPVFLVFRLKSSRKFSHCNKPRCYLSALQESAASFYIHFAGHTPATVKLLIELGRLTMVGNGQVHQSSILS